ncbi:DUF6427 family protein [Mesonia sp. K7]|uniref:DUF6427 family protein n=1 Tax=Mesonia sp. K7 TaxID=2218606 RepID=UPI000DAA47E2|nr:DUF6427 family protein [Mesonia sp. K7]PZD79100.1 hypothetical protein DNG35_03585 [Mesonia sp. K7]
MLTSFFKKSKPVNYLIICCYFAFYFLIANFFIYENEISAGYLFKKIGYLFLFVLLILVLNFILKRNDIHKNNSFGVLLFVLFSVGFLPILKSADAVLAVFFITLAFRRVFSLKSGKNIKIKIFDACLWVLIASLFFSYSYLYLIIPVMGVFYYANDNIKNLFIPLVAIFCFFVLVTTFSLLTSNEFFLFEGYFSAPSIDFKSYHALEIIIPLSILLAILVWSFVSFYKETQEKIRKEKPLLYLLAVISVLGILMILLSPEKTGEELLFLCLPAGMITTFFFEKKGEKWLKELLLLTLIVCNILIPILFW